MNETPAPTATPSCTRSRRALVRLTRRKDVGYIRQRVRRACGSVTSDIDGSATAYCTRHRRAAAALTAWMRMARRYGVGATGKDWNEKPAPRKRPASAEPRWTTSSAAAQWPPRGAESSHGARPSTATTPRPRQAWKSAHGTVWDRCVDSAGASARERSQAHTFALGARTRVVAPAREPWRTVAAVDTPQASNAPRPSGKGAARLIGIREHTLGAFHTASWYRDQDLAALSEVTVIRRPPA